MTTTNLTTTRSPHDVAAMLDRLYERREKLGDVLGALGLPAVELAHMPGRMVAYAGDGPNSAEIEYVRAPMATPCDATRTVVTMSAHDREGRTLTALIEAALSA